MPGGGGCGGSLEWLLDEPGLEAPDCGFFICMKKAKSVPSIASGQICAPITICGRYLSAATVGVRPR